MPFCSKFARYPSYYGLYLVVTYPCDVLMTASSFLYFPKEDRIMPGIPVVAKEKKLKSTTEEWELPYSGLDGRCIEKSIGEYKYKICASLGF